MAKTLNYKQRQISCVECANCRFGLEVNFFYIRYSALYFKNIFLNRRIQRTPLLQGRFLSVIAKKLLSCRKMVRWKYRLNEQCFRFIHFAQWCKIEGWTHCDNVDCGIVLNICLNCLWNCLPYWCFLQFLEAKLWQFFVPCMAKAPRAQWSTKHWTLDKVSCVYIGTFR